MRTSRSGRIHAQLWGISVLIRRVEAVRVLGYPEVIDLEVFYDYLCPFVYRASVMLQNAGRSRKLNVTWSYFSLTQVNSRDEGWTVWDAPASERVLGRLAFMAAEAARRQGRFEAFHVPLLQARHRDRLEIDRPEVVERVAVDSGLDLERFRQDLADPGILGPLEHDHLRATREHGVFGTPTFLFSDGAAAYVRLAEAPEAAEAIRVLDRVISVAASEPSILEIKRPRKPATD
jgi:predicted DsbA family dithiol-disulfide isomerase